jgi:hypothetical protein
MGKRKLQDELSENANTKRNREYTARMDEEKKAIFNKQKALQVAIGRAKQKLYETDEFQKAGDDKRIELEAAVIQETLANRYTVIVHVVVQIKLTVELEKKKESTRHFLHLVPPNQRDKWLCTLVGMVIQHGKTWMKM